mgnify:CR=1 FL=1
MAFRYEKLIVPVITPRKDGQVDIHGLTRLLEFLIAGGIDSLFILGTTGEFQYLTIDEKMQVLTSSAKAISHRVPLLVGISSPTPEETIDLAEAAASHQAQATVLAPMYGWGVPEAQVETILRKSSLPLLLYNNPAIHRNRMIRLDLIEKYARYSGITGIKDSSGDCDYFKRLLELRSEKFTVLQGKESQILQSLLQGADGIVPGSANVDPEPFVQIVGNRNEENLARIIRLKEELRRLSAGSIHAIKITLAQQGIIGSEEMFG